MRDDFSEETKETAAKRVNYLCSCPTCRCFTISAAQKDSNKTSLIGVAAHITAASKGGKRYDSSMSANERKSIDNCIWLCENHAKLIDTDESKYTVELLKQWKNQTEDYVQNAVFENAKRGNNNIYLFEEWFDKYRIDKWGLITENLLKPIPMMNEKLYDNFLKANIWLSKNIHNVLDSKLKNLLYNFCECLKHLLEIFEKHSYPNDVGKETILVTEPYRYNSNTYKSIEEHSKNIELIYELGFEVTKYINAILNILRENYNCDYAKEKVNLLYTTDILDGYKSVVVEFAEGENTCFNLGEFLLDSKKRIFNDK